MRVWLALVPFLLLAGCSDAPSADPPAEEEPMDTTGLDAQPEPTPVEVLSQVAWEGRTKEGFFVCDRQDGTGACPAGQQVQPDGAHTTTVAYNGTFSDALIHLEWTPVDASQTGLVLVAYGPDGQLNLTRGSGDLTLGLDASMGLPGDGGFLLAVWPEGKTPTEPSLFVDATRQPFSVIVDIVTLEVPADPDAGP